jgi:haloalkane dehalogenase
MVTAPPIPDWLAGEYPFSPRSFRTRDGANLSYLDEGPRNDEAVLMLHGNPTWSYYYRHLVRALAPDVRCIVPDHIGMGLSEKPPLREYTLESRIADVDALAGSLRLKRIHLVVHDWGGAIGFGYAARYPARIGRIAIMNTAAFTDQRIPLRIALCRAPGLGPLWVRGANGFAAPAVWMAMHRRALAPAERRGYLWPYNSWANRVGVNAFVQDIPLSSVDRSWATLKRVEAGLAQFRRHESLIVWGGRDFCFNDGFLARWREFLPQAEVRHLADAGHYVLDDAREEVVPGIRAFLASR